MSGELDTPVGVAVPQRKAPRLLAGRGRYTDDVRLPRMLHLAFVRSPYGHARIRSIDSGAAAAMPGVARVVTGSDMARLVRPWQGLHAGYPKLRSPPQWPLAVERACWHGEPVVAVAAETRAQAEDAAEAVAVEWEELPAVADPEAALASDAPRVHPGDPDNIAFGTTSEAGDPKAAFAAAHLVLEETFRFGRHTGVPLEPRAIVADFDPTERRLTVWQSHQTPHQMQDIYARHLGIPEQNVRVVCPDVGGAFGIKLQLYGDEIAACAMSMLLGRPVKFAADRLEAMLTDIHARDHVVRARMAFREDGRIAAIEVDDLFAIGPYSLYPRSSIGEGRNVLNLTGAPYAFEHYRGRLRMVFQNRNLVGHYRAVGHPVACAVTEGLIERGARRLGLDPLEIRRRNYLSDFPAATPGGMRFERLTLAECQARLEAMVDLPAFRAEQARLRDRGVHRGIGFATFVETVQPAGGAYGRGGIRVTAQDGCILKLEPSGTVRCISSVTDQGQGTETGVAQIVAAALGLPLDSVRVESGDGGSAPYGGGAWASRGLAIAGEAALRAAAALRRNILDTAAAILQADAAALTLRDGSVIDADGRERLPLAELGRIAWFRPDMLPPGTEPRLTVVEHWQPRERPYEATNGMQASVVEVDVETGFVRLLRHVVVHDCGRVVNPLLVEEQIRGGVVQGLGAALFEECLYDSGGQMLNGSLIDYVVPMAAEMPDIEVAHVEGTPAASSLGVKGVGEAGTAGAAAAVLNAVNDALAPLGASLAQIPLTPDRVLAAIEGERP